MLIGGARRADPTLRGNYNYTRDFQLIFGTLVTLFVSLDMYIIEFKLLIFLIYV